MCRWLLPIAPIAQAEGVVKLAYAGLDPIEAGRAVATLTFARKDEMSTTITVSNQEVKTPGLLTGSRWRLAHIRAIVLPLHSKIWT